MARQWLLIRLSLNHHCRSVEQFRRLQVSNSAGSFGICIASGVRVSPAIQTGYRRGSRPCRTTLSCRSLRYRFVRWMPSAAAASPIRPWCWRTTAGDVIPLESQPGVPQRHAPGRCNLAPVDAHLREHVLEPDRAVRREQHEPLQQRAQLRRVAPPRQRREQRHARPRQRLQRHAVCPADFLQEVVREKRDVFTPLPAAAAARSE